MKLYNFGKIEKLARDAKHLYQDLEQAVETIEANNDVPNESIAVEEVQKELQDKLEQIHAETEHISLQSHIITRSEKWVPSPDAFEITRETTDGSDTGTVTITATESVPLSKNPTVYVGGSKANAQFTNDVVANDTLTLDVADDTQVSIEWESVQKVDDHVELPLDYNKTVSNESLNDFVEAPSEDDNYTTHTKVDRNSSL
jgi:CO dehydrogenase/acetyl-CoA synthase delta subunit